MRSSSLEQLVQGLHARDIAAFPVVHAGVGEDVVVVRTKMKKRDFTHMPLRDRRGNVVAILDYASDRPIPLTRKHLIDAGAPLPAAITRLPETGFLLVRSAESGYKDHISGIINHADVLKLQVRFLIYTRTMQLERRVLDAITGQNWGEAPTLGRLWQKVDRRYRDGGEQRSSREAYLGFSEIMLIGQVQRVLPLSDEDLRRLCTARNFASHAAIDAPARELRPELVTGEVEQCVSLVERLALVKRSSRLYRSPA